MFSAMLLYEPILVPPSAATSGTAVKGPEAQELQGQYMTLVQMARKRRNVFASMEAAMENFLSKPPYKNFTPVEQKASLEGSLRPKDPKLPEGEVILACEREYEAACYRHFGFPEMAKRIAEVRAEVRISSGELSHAMNIFAS